MPEIRPSKLNQGRINATLYASYPRVAVTTEGVDKTYSGGSIMGNNTTIPEADKNFVGEVLESNSCGPFRVVERAGKTKSNNALYSVEFLKTGYKAKAKKWAAKNGQVFDPFHPSICGVAYMGNSTSRNGKGEIKTSYNQWRHMIHRCYDDSNQDYHRYGGRGIYVCGRWLCFEVYEQDIRSLPGFEKQDHDSIDRVDNNGPYAPTNCRWATPFMQSGNTRNLKEFVAVSPCGDVFVSDNQAEFSRQHNLNKHCIGYCLKGKQKAHQGWTFHRPDSPTEAHALVAALEAGSR